MTKRHEARHPLPISNGYGGGMGTAIMIYCGRCDGYFLPDEEWVSRYFSARRARLEADTYLRPGAKADALADVDAAESDALAQVGALHE